MRVFGRENCFRNQSPYFQLSTLGLILAMCKKTMSTLSVFYFWEAIEHYLETGLVGNVVSNWFQGVDFWANRLVADPLMMILGYYLAQRFPRLVNPARGCSIVWFFVHVFVFPHSMYLHVYFAST